jgi:hypothetical protein
MPVLYAVRCRFTDPARERAWNEWYAGHLAVLLGVPGFLAAQRFRSATTPDDRPYLALYEVAGPEVFTSDAYLAIWGFDEWRALIDNWTRDLFAPRDGGALDFATPPGGALRAAFVSGGDGPVDAALGRLASRRPAVRTALVAGLDVSCGGIAWDVLEAGDDPGPPAALEGVQVAEAVYAPITACLRPDPAASEVTR